MSPTLSNFALFFYGAIPPFIRVFAIVQIVLPFWLITKSSSVLPTSVKKTPPSNDYDSQPCMYKYVIAISKLWGACGMGGEGWRGTVGRGYLKISFILFFCSAAVSKSIRMLAGGGEGMENDFLLSNLIRHFYFYLSLSFLVDNSKLD